MMVFLISERRTIMVESTSVQIKCHHGLFYAIFCVKVKQSILVLVKCLVCASVLQ